MYENRSTDFELSELEDALRRLDPAEPELNREKLMFLAGQASVQPRRPVLWQGVSGVLAIASCTLLMLLVREPQTSEMMVEINPSAQSESAVEAAPRPTPDATFVKALDVNERPTSLAMRRVALRQGIDALPSFVPDTGRHGYTPTSRELLREMVPRTERDVHESSITPWHWRQVLSKGDAI